MKVSSFCDCMAFGWAFDSMDIMNWMLHES